MQFEPEYSAPEIPPEYWMEQRKCHFDGLKAQRQMLQGSEKDPNGLTPSTPGAKLDAGKQRPALVLSGFAKALRAVTEIGTFGARKYTENGWMSVPDGIRRYEDAGLRHKLTRMSGEEFDPESGYLHLAHEAWNILAVLELVLREKENGRRGTEGGA